MFTDFVTKLRDILPEDSVVEDAASITIVIRDNWLLGDDGPGGMKQIERLVEENHYLFSLMRREDWNFLEGGLKITFRKYPTDENGILSATAMLRYCPVCAEMLAIIPGKEVPQCSIHGGVLYPAKNVHGEVVVVFDPNNPSHVS